MRHTISPLIQWHGLVLSTVKNAWFFYVVLLRQNSYVRDSTMEFLFVHVIKDKVVHSSLIPCVPESPKQESPKAHSIGEVFLVGAGPGDPELITVKAMRLLQEADAIVYDRLANPLLLDYARKHCDLIYVGKKKDQHSLPQDQICALLAALAGCGKKVVRLKGGDPFIFGRGGEEIETLAEHGIPFQVVPGITAASGCASYAGIPLTHRDHAQSVRFIAGHLRSGKMDLNWPELVQPNQTLVFYMGLNGMETICEQLKQHGLDAQTPAALIEKGTTDRQQVFIGDLNSLPEIVRSAGAKAPTLIIVGHVVSLQDKLAWFNVTETAQ